MNSTTIDIGKITLKRIGLGTNRLTDTSENRELLNKAVKLGYNFIDTANIYTSGNSEQTIGKTLSPFPQNIIIATKGGMVRGAPADNSPAHLRNELEQSLARLKTDSILLYQLHRVNPDTPIENTMQFLKSLQDEGMIKHIGLSEVTVEQIERAKRAVNIVSVQNHYNMYTRKHDDVIEYCEKNNIIFIPYFPLGKPADYKDIIYNTAKKYNVSPQQILLAWLLKRSPVMLPIPGTLSQGHLKQNIDTLKIELSEKDFDLLSQN
jgi:aryl-alcohol dehydrogenase-like predicted oxidoreductase